MKDTSHSTVSAVSGKVSFQFPLVQQCGVLILAGLILDGGQTLQIAAYAALAYWGGSLLVVTRRRNRLTRLDRFLIRWGFIMLLTVSAFLTGWIWSLQGH